MPLDLFYTMVQKSQKWPKTQIKGGPALNSTERGALFQHFCVSKVITTAHAHKSGVIFHFFPRAFKQKKKLRLYDQRWLK